MNIKGIIVNITLYEPLNILLSSLNNQINEMMAAGMTEDNIMKKINEINWEK